jgi:drug/metabolite transporter (DMT)-like permease
VTSPAARRRSGDAIMLGAVLLMGSSYPLAKAVLATMSPLLYSGSRYILAGLFLFAVLAIRRLPMALPRRDWMPMIALAVIGVVVFQSCWGLGMYNTAPSLGSIVMTTTTAFGAILAHISGRKLSVAGWSGIAIAFVGVAIVVNNSLTRFTISLDNIGGSIFWLVAAFAWALYVYRGAPYNARLGALRVMAWTTTIGSVLLTMLALVFDSPAEFFELSGEQWTYWFYTAIFPVGVSFLGLTIAFDRLGVSRVMLYMYLIPIAAVALSAVFFRDPLTPARILGGLIVLAGVILTRVALDRPGRKPDPSVGGAASAE